MNKIQIIILISLFTISCSKSNTEESYQGPQNPSFEFEGAGTMYAQYWTFNKSAACELLRRNGLEFMPTNGSWYLEFKLTNLTDPTAEVLAWQENVDFSSSSRLTFDYSYNLYGNVTFQLLFTADGTIKLWEKIFTNSPVVNGHQLNETVNLPALPNSGKLTIKVAASGLTDTGTNPTAYFNIDNLKVQ